MGCDIHAVLEVKVDKKWVGLTQPNFQRNYGFFSAMAGVRAERREDLVLYKAKGLPSDMSELSMLVVGWWDGDGHSHSYLTAIEITLLLEFCDLKDILGDYYLHNAGFYVNGGCPSDFIKYREVSPSNVQDVRLVFFFDN